MIGFVRLIAVATLVATFPAAAFEDVHRCDEFAAHPADPERWASGVADADIIPGPAVAFCKAAANEHPDVSRFRFQLARAYWAAGRQEDAVPLLLAMAEQEHGPSLAYLSTALQRGLGGMAKDPALAERFAERAAAAGFASAPAVVAPSPQATRQPVAARAFNSAMYNQPGVIGALHDGRLEAMRIDGVGQGVDYVPLSQELVYLSGLHNSFADPVSRVLDRDCVLLHKPAVGERLVARAMNEAFGGSLGAGGLDGLAQEGWGMIGRMMSDLAKGDVGGMAQKGRNTELLRQMGEQDGERLLVAHGCASDVARRIYGNLEAFVTGTDPVRLDGAESAGAAAPTIDSENAAELRRRWGERERARELDAARRGLGGGG